MTYKDNFIDSTGTKHTLSLRFHRESRMRYRADNIEQLFDDDYKLLKKLVNHHRDTQVPRIQELMDYAQGINHKVLESGRRREQDMADNRAVHNYGRMISKFKTGYLAGNPIRVSYDDQADDSKVDNYLSDLARSDSYDNLNRNLIKDMSQVGRAFELCYRGSDDITHTKQLDTRETFVVYDNTIENNVIAGIRHYVKDIFDNKGIVIEVYTKNSVLTLSYKEDITLESQKEHGFGDVPITEYLNNPEGLGDYETELYLIDLYDASQSDTANYMTDLSDAILAIFGDIDIPNDLTASERADYLSKMKRARLMLFKPPFKTDGTEGSVDAKYLYKQYDVNGTEAYKTRINKDIHTFTNTPNMTDENFSGNSSGESLKYKLFGLDQDRIDTQSLFTVSLKRRYQLITNLAKTASELTDFDISKLSIVFTPNLPKSTQEQVTVLKDLGGQVSNETALAVSGIVDKPKDEIDKINQESIGSSVLQSSIDTQKG